MDCHLSGNPELSGILPTLGVAATDQYLFCQSLRALEVGGPGLARVIWSMTPSFIMMLSILGLGFPRNGRSAGVFNHSTQWIQAFNRTFVWHADW
jgi:hypothetical protein